MTMYTEDDAVYYAITGTRSRCVKQGYKTPATTWKQYLRVLDNELDIWIR